MFPPPIQEKKEKEGNAERETEAEAEATTISMSTLSRSATFHEITQSMIGEMESDDDSDAGGEETGSTWYQMCDQSLRSFHLIARRVRFVSCFQIIVLHLLPQLITLSILHLYYIN